MSHHLPSSPLPFSKVCDLNGDAESLGPWLQQVDRYPDALTGQHPIRRWEYAMALYAIQGWQDARDAAPLTQLEGGGDPLQICDVGGAGSNFCHLLTPLTTEVVELVDPNWKHGPSPRPPRVAWHACSVEDYAAATPHNLFDLLTCISVIEHVRALGPFFAACHTLLKPGGLLFLTTDYWDGAGEDTAHFHWMRQRIYTTDRLTTLRAHLLSVGGFQAFGTTDWTYHGPQLYDYSVASVAMVKKP